MVSTFMQGKDLLTKSFGLLRLVVISLAFQNPTFKQVILRSLLHDVLFDQFLLLIIIVYLMNR